MEKQNAAEVKNGKKKKDTYVSIWIYLYLALPTLIFLIGWLRWYWALLFGVLSAVACVKAFIVSMQDKCLVMGQRDISMMIKALLLIALWVYLSGIGGWCYQNKDHEVRSAIFRALVNYDWPVISHGGDRALIYYIGFWLPAACIGKLFGLEAGYTAQVVWAVMGIFIVYYLICIYRRKADLLPLLFLVFFSGLDYAGTWILGEEGMDLRLALHLEWWAVDFQFTSMTSQLFWVFNQAIPAWVATIMVLVQKNCRNMLFILSLMMLSSTIPFVGLIPIAAFLYLRRIAADRGNWKEIITFQNIVGVLVIGGCMFLYLTGNISGRMIGKDNAGLVIREPAAQWLRYLLFFFLEAGVYLYFVYKYRKRDWLVFLITFLMAVSPFIKVGADHDFCMRASVPSLFILMLMCMEVWEGMYSEIRREVHLPALAQPYAEAQGERAFPAQKGNYADKRVSPRKCVMAVYCVILLLGAFTPFNEIHRSVQETYWRVTLGESVRYPEIGIEKELLQYGNFSGEIRENFFYRYLANVPAVYSCEQRTE